MKVPLSLCLLLLSACSSQVSLGTQDEHASSMSEASVTSTDASVSTVDGAIETHAPSTDGSADAPSVDELHMADAPSDAPHYDPCAGKACGVACTACDPHDLHCVEPPGSKQCNPHQQCVTALVCP
jgi:hypothetical protein